MALQDFARVVLFLDGTNITMMTSLDAEWESGQQPVDLLNEGLSGFTPGSGRTTVTIGVAVPIGGLEYPYLQNLVDGAFVDLQLGVGAEAMSARGKITAGGLSQSVNGSLEGKITWMGQFRAPE